MRRSRLGGQTWVGYAFDYFWSRNPATLEIRKQYARKTWKNLGQLLVICPNLSRICPTTLSIRALEFELSFRYCIRPNKGVTRMLISYCLRQLIIDSDNCKSGSSHVYVFKSLAYCLTSFICKPWKSLSASLSFWICSHIWHRQFFLTDSAQLRTWHVHLMTTS